MDVENDANIDWYRSDMKKRLLGFLRDTSGQGMTEYVILTSVCVAVAAWLYYPDNGIMQGMRHTYDKTSFLLAWPGP